MRKEILLIRKVYSTKQLYRIKENYIDNLNSRKDNLLTAFNNLLLYLMPEILEENSPNKKLYMCKITETLLLIELNFQEISLELESKYSLDPYLFLPLQIPS